jgi:hypothetical protein
MEILNTHTEDISHPRQKLNKHLHQTLLTINDVSHNELEQFSPIEHDQPTRKILDKQA